MVLLKVDEVARTLQVSPRIVYRWIHDGRIASVRVGEKLVRVDERELQFFLNRERRREGVE